MQITNIKAAKQYIDEAVDYYTKAIVRAAGCRDLAIKELVRASQTFRDVAEIQPKPLFSDELQEAANVMTCDAAWLCRLHPADYWRPENHQGQPAPVCTQYEDLTSQEQIDYEEDLLEGALQNLYNPLNDKEIA